MGIQDSADRTPLNEQAIVRLFAALEKGDIGECLTIWAEDCRDHAAIEGAPPGKPGVQATLEFVHAAFRSARWQVIDMVSNETSVACQIAVAGTHDGEIYGVPATGRQVRWRHAHFFHLRDGLIVEHDAVRDDQGLLQQLTGGYPSGARRTATRQDASPPGQGHGPDPPWRPGSAGRETSPAAGRRTAGGDASSFGLSRR